ncbi:hypothetical protein N480_25485, partial [Pseudoalteromonas luteoviolacea S2607]
ENLCVTDSGVRATNLAYVIYTSGSTGQPKGVEVEHQGVVAFLSSPNYANVEHARRMASLSSFSFDGFVYDFFFSLASGVELHLFKKDSILQIDKFKRELIDKSINNFFTTTALFNQLVAHDVFSGTEVRQVLFGGERCDEGIIESFKQSHPHISLMHVYGPTESIVFASTCSLNSINSAYPIGQPLNNNSLYVLDSFGEVSPFGSVGELYVGGASLARGYLNRPTLTAERFIENPFYNEDDPNSSKRLYRTGDLVRFLADGHVDFIGRADDQVKIRGFRIELGEVESQLALLGSVDSALVMAKDIAGSQQLVGYVKPSTVVSDNECPAYANEITTALLSKMPDYMVPSVIVLIDTWPLTPNGKIDRKVLPTPDERALHGKYSAPVSDTEHAVADIWSKLLGVDVDLISRTANFFELGGHSLLSVRLVSDIRNRFKVEISVQAIFEAATLQDLALMIEQGTQVNLRPAITPFTRGGNIHPVSFAQQRLWFIDNLQGGSPEYNMPLAFDVNGKLNIATIRAAFNTILERHEVLRTVYINEQGETLQCIRALADCQFNIQLTDVSHLTGETLAARVSEIVNADTSAPYNLASDIMLRVHYVKKADDRGVMILNMHHIASDGWSLNVLAKEFVALYEAYHQEQPNPLPALAIQYADYGHWQRTYLRGALLESQLEYWQKQLVELPVLHSLPLDYSRPDVKQYQGAVVTGQLSASIAQQLLVVAKQYQLTPFMLFHGVLSLLIARHSNHRDVVIGTPVANRLQTELEPLIGFFVNTLVLRANTQYNTLSDYFAHIRQINLDAQSNQDVPFEQLVEQLKVPRSTAHSPLFQIMMAVTTDDAVSTQEQNIELSAAGVDIQLRQSNLSQAKFDLDINFHISERGVSVDWTYDISLFSAAHIVQLNDHLCRLLEGVSEAQPTHAPYAMPMLSIEETQHLVFEVNNTHLEYPKDRCIHELFEQQAAASPDNVALVFEHQTLTYRQLNEKANQLAHYLRATQGITPDSMIGLCVERSLEMVIGILAILKAGGAYVPLDPSYPQERLDYMLDDAQLSIVLSQRHLQAPLSNFDGRIITLDGLACSEHHVCAHSPVHDLSTSDTGVEAANLAYVIYTSGSTGMPKGVLVEHRSVINLIFSQKRAYQLEPQQEAGLLLASYAFDAAVEQMFIMLFTANTLVIPSRKESLEPAHITRLVATHQITHIDSTPSHLMSMIESLSGHAVKRVVSGGEAMLPQLVDAIDGRIPLYNVYGPTESCVTSSVSVEPASIGRPIGNTEFYVLDSDNMLVPKGTVGELYIGGDGVARGYLNLPEVTAERFMKNPYLEQSGTQCTRRLSQRLYKTGDLVRYLPDGNLEYIGRIDEQVKIRGFRIELGEVESQLVRLDSVDSALVMATELAGSQQLVGYIKPVPQVFSSGHAEYIHDVKSQLARVLPDYMVPSVVMVVDTWPLTHNGKVDRAALPTPESLTLQGSYIAPMTHTEVALTDIWAELLGIEVDHISATASFFELGGHSLLVVKLLSLIEKHFKKTSDIAALYSQNTIQQQATLLDSLECELNNITLLRKVVECSEPHTHVVFIPGAASTAADFEEVIDDLKSLLTNRTEMSVFRHKGLIIGEQSFKTIDDNVVEFADSIGKLPSKRIVLVGHSYGGALAFALANYLTAQGYQVELVMLDTYFWQKGSCFSNRIKASRSTDLSRLDLPRYFVDLYTHQCELFDGYTPTESKLVPKHWVFAKESPVEQDKYLEYLNRRLSIQNTEHVFIEGNHFSMLKGESAKSISGLIVEIIKNMD